MPALTKQITGFGIRDLAVALAPTAPASTPTWVDVPLVEQANYKHDVKEVELWGDDAYQGTFYHSATGKITAKVNRMALNVFELLSGVSALAAVVSMIVERAHERLYLTAREHRELQAELWNGLTSALNAATAPLTVANR